MGTLVYLFAAYTVIWLAVFVYTYSIGARQKGLERDVETLKAVLAERDARPGR